MFKTIEKEITYELVEKKSKFIANLFYVENEEEAEEKIKALKKQYYDARHNCYAYRIYKSDGIIERFSDDGEPSGTAGGPMLNLLKGKEIANVLIVVTRYFGGILLGTGGLVRAYTDSSNGTIENSIVIEKDLGLIAKFKVSYSDNEKLKYYFKQEEIRIVDSIFDENVTNIVEITQEKYTRILKNKNELNFNIIEQVIEREAYIKI